MYTNHVLTCRCASIRGLSSTSATSDEESAARAAAVNADNGAPTMFGLLIPVYGSCFDLQVSVFSHT